MLLVNTLIRVIDNSGARFAECINILGKSQRSRAKVGDILVVCVKKAIPNKVAKRGTIYKAVVVRTRFCVFRYGGIVLKFNSSAIVLLNNRSMLLGTRILGPVSKELRDRGFFRIVSLAPAII